MAKRILIGGGSGLVGNRLTDLLMNKGYSVSHLSRSKSSKSRVESIQWDVENQKLNPDEIEGFDAIINLAGAGIADKAWTDQRKQVIEKSRVDSNLLLKKTLESLQQKPKFFISASAIGYYGLKTTDHVYKEDEPPGDDFLADTCVKWENSADEVKSLGIPTAKVRIGLVLTDEGGALAEIERPFKWGVGAVLGGGNQGMPWIHIDDLCGIFIHILEHQLEGVYNGAAPNGVDNKTFSRTLAQVLDKKLFLPPVPAFALRLIMGSRADLVLKGSLVSAEKIQGTNFTFEFKDLKSALEDIYL